MTDDAPTAADYEGWSQPDLPNRGWTTPAEQELVAMAEAALKYDADGRIKPGGWAPPSETILDLPEIRVRRGSPWPLVGLNHTTKREGWRRWFVQVRLHGSDDTHRFGPFTRKSQARQVRAALIELHREMDYQYRYKIKEKS